MRNLKKMLSLVMALAMIASFMVVGASAAEFTDAKDIKNTDAVNTLVTLGVIGGRDTGAFDPTGIVTRAELAKMVCVAINGGTDPVLGSTTVTSYKDTVGHWASGYIEYCTNLEIVSGDGAGNFNPNATVTGAQAAKMLLVTLGYDPAVFGFTGINWQVNTDVQANSAKLYNGMKGMNSTEGLTRDNAALMVYNALSSNVMVKTYDKIMSNGEISYSYALSKTETLLSEKFGVVTVEGIVVGNEFSNLSGNQTAKAAGETVIRVTNDGDGQDVYNNGNATFKVTTGTDVLGRSVSLFVKPSATSESNASKGTVIGGVLLSGDNVVVTDSGIKTLDKLAKDNDLKVDVDTDGAGSDIAETTYVANYGNATDLTTVLRDAANVRGVLVTLIDNDGDDTVEYVLTETYNFGKVSKYSTKDDGSITVTGIGAVSKDDAAKVVGFEDVKKGDYVLYAEIGGKLYVQKPEIVEGKISAYKNTTASASGTVTMDGTKYTASGLFSYSDSSKLKDPNGITAFSTGTAYLDKQGYIVAIGDSAEESGDYALVLGYAAGISGVDSNRVKVALSDGTTGTYTVNECRNAANTGADTTPVVYRMYTYSMTDDKEINLREIAVGKYVATNYNNNASTGAGAAGSADALDFTKGKTTIAITGNKYYADDSTVFFYATTTSTYFEKSDVYTGINKAPSIDSTDGDIKYLIVTDGANVAKAVVAVDATAAANGDFLYLVKYTGKTSDGWTYKAIVGDDFLTEEITIKNGANDLAGPYQYTINSKGNYEVSAMAAASTAYGVVGRDPTNKSIVISALDPAQDGEYVLMNDSVIAYIDSDDTYTEAEIGKGDAVTIVYSDKNEIDGIYITAAQADDAADVVYYDATNVTLTAGKYQIEAGASYDAVAEILAAFLPSSGATALLNKADPGDGQTAAQLAALITAGDTADTFTATTTNYLIIIAADGESYSVTPVEMVAP